MATDTSVDELVQVVRARQQAGSTSPGRVAKGSGVPKARMVLERTLLSQDAPSPRLDQQIAEHGPELSAAALDAWQARIGGTPIIDVAHELGLSIESAKVLLRDVHQAIRDDLKDALELNRELDLQRVDGLIRRYYPQALQGDLDSATVTLKCLQHRSKLTGTEPQPDPGRTKEPGNVLVWIQQRLPQIHQIVDALPPELPPRAP